MTDTFHVVLFSIILHQNVLYVVPAVFLLRKYVKKEVLNYNIVDVVLVKMLIHNVVLI